MVAWDVAVVGAGPAGIAAAVAAAEAGRRVVVLDEGQRPGGQIWRHREGEAPAAARPWLTRLARSGAELRLGAAVVDVEGPVTEDPERGFRLTLEGGEGAGVVEAARIVVATGARELFLPFPGWTLPGVVGVGGAQALLKSGLEVAGKRVVVAGSGPLLLPVSAALAAAGADVRLVAEQAPPARVRHFAVGLWRHPRRVLDAVTYRSAAWRTPYRLGSWVTRARGEERLQAVEVSLGGRRREIECDLLCTGFGLVPNLALARLLGCEVVDGVVRVDGHQRTSVEGVWCAGEGTGVAGVDASLVEGTIAGLAAAGRPEAATPHLRARDRARRFGERMRQAFASRPELRAIADAGTLVCRCEDVRLEALRAEWSGRQAKLYTRIGMGPCQGRVCGPAAEYLFGWQVEGGRMPASVATVETLAGAGDG